MKSALTLAAVLALGACSASSPDKAASRPPDPNMAVEVMRRQYRLPASAGRAEFDAFQQKVDKAYSSAAEQYSASDDAGFVYSLSPAGAVNPFSVIEVSCISRETHAGRAARHCDKFFSLLDQ